MSASRRSTVIVENLRRHHMNEQIASGSRLDGRKFDEIRPLKIETNVIQKANGSAWVKLGNTEVVAGVKVETGEPFEGLENKGALIVSAEVLPTASPFVEPGPPDEETIELARVVDRGIRESEMLALDKLALVPGKIVYTVFVDCSIVNTDGNLFDATSYAVVTALLTSKFPIYDIKDEKAVDTGKVQDPPINTVPVSLTFARIGDALILDPSTEEEVCMDARITITTNSDGQYTAVQKGSNGYLTLEQVQRAADIAKTMGQELRQRLIPGGKKEKT
ncbi:MAG TPA: exosome complex protein Rrp42 [Nitrososphaeraceae archaeon]